MSGTGYVRLCDALTSHGINVKGSTTDQDVKCPAHEDKTASLSIGQGRKGAVIHCQAGCATDAILSAVNLTATDLFDDKKRSGFNVVDEYSYVDESGSELFQAVRMEPKDFRQRHSDGSGGWVWNMQGIRRVLYRLPEVAAAASRGDWVVVVEGEKDADRLHREGIVATTNPMGAGKWSKCETSVLTGANVAVIPDNDQTGRNHAAEVAADLAPRASTVKVVRLDGVPEKGDASTWLNNGGSADRLRSLILETEPWTGDESAPAVEAVPAIDPATAPPVTDALTAIDGFLDRFMHFESNEQRHAVVLWAAGTHVYDAYDVTPYLHIKSPVKRAGKTLLLDLLEFVVRSPMATNDLSPAALYRIVADRHPTLLIDEVDTVFPKGRNGDPSKEELRGLLNAGYRKGRKALRVGGPRRDEVQEFDVFSPKALAGIGDLPDTIADRCIPIGLQRKPRGVAKQRFRSRKVTPIGTEVHQVVAHAMAGKSEILSHDDPHLPDELNDREQDTWELLFAIADLAGGEWPALARAAALKLSADSQDATETLGEVLLSDIRDVWGDDETALPTKVILERLIALEEAPWSNYFGREIDARFVAQKLKPYGVSSTQVKWEGKNHKGYRWDRLAPVWERYGAATNDTGGATGATSATSLAPQGVSQGYPKATQGLPDDTVSEGSPEVAQRYPTGNPYTPTEVAQVAQVAPDEREPDLLALVSDIFDGSQEVTNEATNRVPVTASTNSVKRDLLACVNGDVDEARALFAATCEDEGYPTDEPLTVDEANHVRTLLNLPIPRDEETA